jgi:hypothetical protein
MRKEVDLKELEKQAYTSIFQDGLLDMFFGLIIIGWITNSLGDFFDTSFVITILFSYYTVVGILIILSKSFISAPRIGRAKFGPTRKLNVKRLIIFAVINTSILVILLVLPYIGLFQGVSVEGYFFALIISTLFIWLPLSIIAFFIKFNRLYIYAIIGGVAFFISDTLRGYFPYLLSSFIVFGVSGGIIFAIGLRIFLKFLKKYPKERKLNG